MMTVKALKQALQRTLEERKAATAVLVKSRHPEMPDSLAFQAGEIAALEGVLEQVEAKGK